MGINSGKDLHQGGFTSAVLSTNAMDLPTADLEGNIVQGHHAREALGDVFKIENNFIIHCSLLLVVLAKVPLVSIRKL
jgi:hypothetical protein